MSIIYVHNNSGKNYLYSKTVGVKIFRWWFYFVLYRNNDMYFIRTKKAFFKKFTAL